MARRIVDLTLRIENNMLAPDCFQRPVYVKAMTHEQSVAMGNGTKEDPITSSYNYLSIIEHVGTHVDSFYHMRPDGLTIDRMPLSMFFGKAVCLDMTHIPERGTVTVADVERAERENGVEIDGHIVLFATGLHERYYPDPRVLTQNVEISPEVVFISIKILPGGGAVAGGARLEGPRRRGTVHGYYGYQIVSQPQGLPGCGADPL